MKKIEISIIMGIYNCENTLQEALDSLYNQTFQDFEIILCDDGSTDNTLSIAEKNRTTHDNIVLLINEKNMGLNYTLNRCLKASNGRYIARMDADDISLPTRLEEEFNFLEQNDKYAFVSTPMIYFDEDGDFKVGKNIGEPDICDFSKGTPFCHAPCMVRRQAYETVDGYTVSEKLLRVEDYHLWIKMYERGYKGYRLEKPLYKMRDDRNAIARRSFKNRKNEMYVRYLACTKLKLPFYSYFYIIKPILVWILPTQLYKFLHRKTRSNEK